MMVGPTRIDGYNTPFAKRVARDPSGGTDSALSSGGRMEDAATPAALAGKEKPMRFRRGILVSSIVSASIAFVLTTGVVFAQDSDPTPAPQAQVPVPQATAVPEVPPPPGSEPQLPPTPLIQATPAATPPVTPEITHPSSHRTPRPTRTPMASASAPVAAPPAPAQPSSGPPAAAGPTSSSAPSATAAPDIAGADTAASAERPAPPPAPIVEEPSSSADAAKTEARSETSSTGADVENWMLIALAAAGLAVVVALVARRRKVERLSILDPMSLSSVHPDVRHAHRL